MSSGVRDAAERELDQVLTDSFPASDPPSWTLGVAQPDHDDADSSEAGGDVAAPDRRGAAPVAGGERSSLRGLVSLLGAAGLALLLPVVILLVGTPVVTAVRGVAHAVAWLLARVGG